MVECGRLPGGSGVTGRTIRSKRTVMIIILFMAGEAVRGRTLELHILMTVATGNIAVLAGQFEDGIIVIKAARLPSARCMTVCTLIAKRAAMRICVAMTGGAVRWCTFEQFICMALTACDRCMLAVQCEGGAAMVKGGRSPAVGCMARSTISAKLAGMRIIL